MMIFKFPFFLFGVCCCFVGLGTGSYYTTSKNPKNVPEKLQLMKYDPVVREHVLFKVTL